MYNDTVLLYSYNLYIYNLYHYILFIIDLCISTYVVHHNHRLHHHSKSRIYMGIMDGKCHIDIDNEFECMPYCNNLTLLQNGIHLNSISLIITSLYTMNEILIFSIKYGTDKL